MVKATDFDFTLEQVSDALMYCNCENRDTWLRMAMAMKVGFGDMGFDAWDRWSSGGSTYDKNNAKTVWRSVKLSGKRSTVTLGTLIHEAKQEGFVFKKESLSDELKKERLLIAEQRKQEYLKRAKLEAIEVRKNQRTVAEFAQSLWAKLSDTGSAPYLDTKKVRAYGLRFVNHAIVIINHEDPVCLELVTGADQVREFFNNRDPDISFHYYKHGTLAIPMQSSRTGAILNLQFITSKGTKKFLKHGKKQDLYHLIPSQSGSDVLSIAEGYATGASVHHATDWNVAIAFDAGNLPPVAQALRKKYPDMQIVIAGDDDIETDGNPGRTFAEKAAKVAGGVAVFPSFNEEGLNV